MDEIETLVRDHHGESVAARLLVSSTGYALGALPGAMVDEREAQAFIRAVMRELGEQPGTRLLHEAGGRTADYLMAHRIPRPAQWLMRWLPRRAGLRLLLEAMRANAWTFARLIRTLVTPHATVREVECQALGGRCCRFEVTGIS